MAESTLDALLELINNFVGHGCRYENELYLNGLEHVEDLVEEDLLCSLYVVFDIFKDE